MLLQARGEGSRGGRMPIAMIIQALAMREQLCRQQQQQRQHLATATLTVIKVAAALSTQFEVMLQFEVIFAV